MESVATLLHEAEAAGLTVTTDGSELVLRGPAAAKLTAERIIDRRADVLTALGVTPERCPSHLDRDDWQDVPAPGRPGWIRTTCKRCGCFIGYRPEGR